MGGEVYIVLSLTEETPRSGVANVTPPPTRTNWQRGTKQKQRRPRKQALRMQWPRIAVKGL